MYRGGMFPPTLYVNNKKCIIMDHSSVNPTLFPLNEAKSIFVDLPQTLSWSFFFFTFYILCFFMTIVHELVIWQEMWHKLCGNSFIKEILVASFFHWAYLTPLDAFKSLAFSGFM